MAVKRTTVADLLRGIEDDVCKIKASHARRFAVLRPFVFERPAGLSRRDAEVAVSEAGNQHRKAMMRPLREQFFLPPDGPLSEREITSLLFGVLRTYVPAFGDPKIVSAKGAIGRPRSGLTDRQKAAIEKAVADGKSVRFACMHLKKYDKKAADALAKAYHRLETKLMRRK